MVSFSGAVSIMADAKVGVGDEAHDRLVRLAGLAPLTGTLVVNPIECLQRHEPGESQAVGGYFGYPLPPA